jgi:hypothetical protein
MVKTANKSGATISAHPAGINDVLATLAVDADNPTPKEMSEAIKTASKRYLAVAFLLGSDKTRYGLLVKEIGNEFLRFLRNKVSSSTSGTYAMLVAEAYDYLCNYKKAKKHHSTPWSIYRRRPELWRLVCTGRHTAEAKEQQQHQPTRASICHPWWRRQPLQDTLQAMRHRWTHIH